MSKPANVVCEGDVCRMVKPDEEPASASGSSSILEMLGAELLGKAGPVATTTLLGPGKYIAIYFSAHWCPPCRGFTPKLAEIYKKFKESHARKDDFEVVFVSSDRSQEDFDEYYKEMPWLAQPWGGDLKKKLSKKFKVQGIPTLVIVDGSSGKLVTGNGREAVTEDPECANFPWLPPTFKDVIAGPLTDKEGGAYTEEVLKGKPTLLYFSAHWCPPCRGFTPVLGKWYEAAKAKGVDLELVFVSSDRDPKQWEEYTKEMPGWKLLPWEDRARKNKLSSMFEVEGIPTLVLVDGEGNTITTNARSYISSDPDAAEFPLGWAPKPLNALTGGNVDILNSSAVVLLVWPGPGGAELKARAEPVLKDLAESTSAQVKASDGNLPEMAFMYAGTGDEDVADLVERVVKFAGAEPPKEGEVLALLLDIPEQCKYTKVFSTISASDVAALVKAYQGQTLETTPLGDD